MCNINRRRNAYEANVLLLLLSSLVTRKVFAIQHWYCITTEQSFRYSLMQKSEFPKMHHYVGFWQIGSYTVYERLSLQTYKQMISTLRKSLMVALASNL